MELIVKVNYSGRKPKVAAATTDEIVSETTDVQSLFPMNSRRVLDVGDCFCFTGFSGPQVVIYRYEEQTLDFGSVDVFSFGFFD